MSAFSEKLNNLRYKWSAQQLVTELLEKKWMEGIIPFLMLAILLIASAVFIEDYYTGPNIASTAKQFAEFGFVAIAMAVVMISGGIDLSVGGMFAMGNMIALVLLLILKIPTIAIIPIVMISGAIMGACNGLLIGIMKTKAFLTTLVSMLIFWAIVNLLSIKYSIAMAETTVNDPFWSFLDSSVFGVPVNAITLIFIAIVCHIILSRSRMGWHVTAVGGERRSARYAGINAQSTLFWVYVFSGVLSALGGVFSAARLMSADANRGGNMEILAITAVVLGGVSLSGGKGTIGRAMIGSGIVFALSNSLMRFGIAGPVNSIFLGSILLLAVGFDVKWFKNLFKTIKKIYVSPSYIKMPPAPAFYPGSGTTFEVNNRLQHAQAIGRGELDGPEDCILDRQNRLYAGVRRGWIIRYSGENFEKKEMFAHIGGRPLGMAFDKDENLIVAIAGMGLYGVRPDGTVYMITIETNRTWHKLKDDKRIRFADDLDIAADGKIYFSELTDRYEADKWTVDMLECRGNGRVLCYDPATNGTKTVLPSMISPNGICLSYDQQSILIAHTWSCTIDRYYIAGPKKGKLEKLISNLPGLPDNINRASDGNYWAALVGVRTPSYELAMEYPAFRRRMVKRLSSEEWMYLNMNNGCVLKFDDKGEILDALWDISEESHPGITSMREHRGYLYLGGLHNDRIGRIKLEGADPNWTAYESYWGKG